MSWHDEPKAWREQYLRCIDGLQPGDTVEIYVKLSGGPADNPTNRTKPMQVVRPFKGGGILLRSSSDVLYWDPISPSIFIAKIHKGAKP